MPQRTNPLDDQTPTEKRVAQRRAAFLADLHALVDTAGVDPASEQVLSAQWKLLAKHWRAFETQQSDLSTWTMLLKTQETLMRVRTANARNAGGQAIQDEFQQWLNEMGMEARTGARNGATHEDDEDEED